MTEKHRWLDSHDNVSKVYKAVWVVCIALILVEPLVHMHPAFEIDKSFGFYGWYGFFACVGLVLAAKVIRVLLMREESYYDAE
jgi:hypothetical protein